MSIIGETERDREMRDTARATPSKASIHYILINGLTLTNFGFWRAQN